MSARASLSLSLSLSLAVQDVLTLFREWDSNGDNSISYDEFRNAIASLGLDLSEAAGGAPGANAKALRKLWSDLDIDGSDTLR